MASLRPFVVHCSSITGTCVTAYNNADGVEPVPPEDLRDADGAESVPPGDLRDADGVEPVPPEWLDGVGH